MPTIPSPVEQVTGPVDELRRLADEVDTNRTALGDVAYQLRSLSSDLVAARRASGGGATPTRERVRGALLTSISGEPPGIIDRQADAVMELLASPPSVLWTGDSDDLINVVTHGPVRTALIAGCHLGDRVEIRLVPAPDQD